MKLTGTIQGDDWYRIAVVGSGVAGIVAAYLLDGGRHEVSLYEKEEELGGHTNTRVIPLGPDRGTSIDTGFIVLNDRTYPTFHRFLQRLNIPVEKTEMSFSYWDEEKRFGYSGTSLNGLFGQRRNLWNPTFYFMLREIRRFAIVGNHALESGELSGQSLGDFLENQNFGSIFQERYLLPMGAAIWSTSPEKILEYPAEAFIDFFRNHGLLSLKDRPQWQTLPGRGRAYVDKFRREFRGRIYRNSKIQSILQSEDRAVLRFTDGTQVDFDFVVLACHADQALALLENPTDLQTNLLSPWVYEENLAVLHSDRAAMPSNRRLWAAWNFLAPPHRSEGIPVYVTYYMNRLQNLKTREDYFVTLNPGTAIDPHKIFYRTRYTHPRYTLESLSVRASLPDLNVNSRILFCGSYFGHGFHEDAVKSGAAVAALFGLDL